MNLIRTTSEKFTHKGINPKVHLCEGPCLSTMNGENRPCCIYCNQLRSAYYRGECNFHESPLIFEFIDKLKFPESKDFCTISICGKIPVICFKESKPELSIVSFYKLFRNIFLLRREMFLVNKEISESDIAVSQLEFPIVLPNYDTEKRESFGGDEGVTIKSDLITFDNIDEAFKSGKWIYLLNFYQSLPLVSSKKRFDDIIVDQGKTWYKIF